MPSQGRWRLHLGSNPGEQPPQSPAGQKGPDKPWDFDGTNTVMPLFKTTSSSPIKVTMGEVVSLKVQIKISGVSVFKACSTIE